MVVLNGAARQPGPNRDLSGVDSTTIARAIFHWAAPCFRRPFGWDPRTTRGSADSVAYLTDDDFENMPEDDHEAFVTLASICRDRLFDTPTDNNDNLTWEAVTDYMNEVTALAEQLGIEGIYYSPEYDTYHSEYARFARSVEYRLAQVRIQRARRNRKSSISISGPGRERIQHHLERLKAEISAADIPEKRKRTLLNRIADFETELAKKRFNLAAAMAVVALVAATAADFSGVLKDAPSLMDAISAVLGHEKQKDDEALERLRLEHEPLKAIPDMRPKPEPKPVQVARSASGGFPDDLDEDVPF